MRARRLQMDRLHDGHATILEAVDIAVVPSSGPEAFGRVVLEAMAMEKPVVATRSGVQRDPR